MKKCLAVLIALVLAFAAFSMVAAAAPSKEGGLISESAQGVDANGKNVQVKVVKSVNKDISPFETEYQKIKKKNGSMNAIAHVDVTAVGDTDLLEYPIKVTIPVSGATAGNAGYFLLKKADGTIVVLDAVMGDGTATADFPELGEVLFVSDMDAESTIDIGTPEESTKDDGKSSETGKTSDKTSDGVVPFVALIMVGAVVLGVSGKKLFVK